MLTGWSRRSAYVSGIVSSRDILTRMVGYGVPQDEAIARMQGTLIGLGRIKVRLTDTGREQRERTIRQLQKKVQDELGIKLSIHEPISIADELETRTKNPRSKPQRQPKMPRRKSRSSCSRSRFPHTTLKLPGRSSLPRMPASRK